MWNKNSENWASAIARRTPDCKILLNLCPFNVKVMFLLSVSLAHSEGSGLPSAAPSLGTNHRVSLLLTQYQVTVTQHLVAAVPPGLILSPSSNLAPIFYPSFDNWVFLFFWSPNTYPFLASLLRGVCPWILVSGQRFFCFDSVLFLFVFIENAHL